MPCGEAAEADQGTTCLPVLPEDVGTWWDCALQGAIWVPKLESLPWDPVVILVVRRHHLARFTDDSKRLL